jgi:hypothetical protein
MIRKIISFVASLLLVAICTSVSAQDIKVTKQIKAFDWLNVAVVDGNQVEGGLHVYADWADITANLKTKQTKIGMMVSIVTGDANMPAGTYRLKTWGVPTNSPLVNEWERVAETLKVATIAARDAYVVADDSKAVLATGTMVIVESGVSGFAETFVYKGGTDNATCWLSLSDNSGAGFIAYGQSTVVYNAAGINSDGVVPGLDITESSKSIFSFEDVTMPLVAGGGLFFVSFPDAWNKPTFYVNDGVNEYPLSDCWTVARVLKAGVMYQEWTANVDFFPVSTPGALSVIVR